MVEINPVNKRIHEILRDGLYERLEKQTEYEQKIKRRRIAEETATEQAELNDMKEGSYDSKNSSTQLTETTGDDADDKNSSKSNMSVISYSHLPTEEKVDEEIEMEIRPADNRPADLCMMAIHEETIELGDLTQLKNIPATDISQNMMMIIQNKNVEWLIDSGATNHFTYSKRYMTNVVPAYKRITVAGGQTTRRNAKETF